MEQRGSAVRLHFRRDFDRHVHPDQVRLRLTVDRPLREIVATTGARLAAAPCALPADALRVRVETEARLELSGSTGALDLSVLSGAAINGLSGGRDFFPASVRLVAGEGSRVGLCGAGRVETVSRAENALLRLDC